MRERGFTLVELLVVLVVLALVMAVVSPYLAGGPAKAEFTATARAIASGLREARGAALRAGTAASFQLDDEGRFYRAGTSRAHRLPPDIRLSLLAPGAREEVRAGVIDFFGDGSSSGGRIRLARGPVRTDVLVDWMTGRVSLDDDPRAR
jgi:general secretion pathway protein H